jgi:hypothetical protein
VAENYMQRVNPNLIIVLHYAGKALWLVLATVFGFIGYKLYALGVQSPGNAEATFPLGISFTLDNAGPGLIVMSIALLCSLVGAVKSKVELTPEAIRLMAHQEGGGRGTSNNDLDVSDPGVIDRIETLEIVWGLTEIAQLYRTPVADLVSEEEAAQIARLQCRKPLPEKWGEEVSSVVRGSPSFEEWLRALPNRDLLMSGSQKSRIYSSLPWCVRLRWGSGVADSVDVFIYATKRRSA